jgi:hypothetical protein
VQGQFDLFWAAVQGSLPFVVLGLCLGAKWHAERRDERLASTARGSIDTSLPAAAA